MKILIKLLSDFYRDPDQEKVTIQAFGQTFEFTNTSQVLSVLKENSASFKDSTMEIFNETYIPFEVVLGLTLEFFFQDSQKFHDSKYIKEKFMIYKPNRFKKFDQEFMERFLHSNLYYQIKMAQQCERAAIYHHQRLKKASEITKECYKPKICQKLSLLETYF